MSNVRGPTSALTEFLRERGITSRFSRRAEQERERAREQEREQEEQAAADSPVHGQTASPSPAGAQRRQFIRNGSSMNFEENEDSDEEVAPEVFASSNGASAEAGPSRPPRGRAAKRAATTPSKEESKGKKPRKDPNPDSDDDDDDDDYNPGFVGPDHLGLPGATSARSNHSYANRTPGSIAYCSSCKMKFTITQYTKTGDKGPLCHKCGPLHGKGPAGGAAAPTPKLQPKAKRQARKKNMFDVTQKATPTLQSYCIEVISKHIENVEALGNIGFRNLDAISRSISKNRSLNPLTVQLFLSREMTTLSLYDCSKLDSESLQSLATFAPNLEHINLQLCGMLDNAAIDVWATKLTKLKSLELYGPFLVRKEAWHRFLEAIGPRLESFKIRESPRFDLSCAEAMVRHCPNIRELGLAQIGPLNKSMLQALESYDDQLTYLDISDPGVSAPGIPPKSLEDEEVVSLLKAVGKNLTYLDLSKNIDLTNAVVQDGLQPCCKHLQTLRLVGCEKFETAAMVEMFRSWSANGIKGLRSLHLDRLPHLDDGVVEPLLHHSGSELTDLSLNSVDAITDKGLEVLSSAKNLPQLESLDLSFVRAVEDKTLSLICNNLPELKKVYVFGCNRISDFIRSDKVRIIGKEKYAA